MVVVCGCRNGQKCSFCALKLYRIRGESESNYQLRQQHYERQLAKRERMGR